MLGSLLDQDEIEEFMARMRREKKWRQEDEEHEHQLDAREEEMRDTNGKWGIKVIGRSSLHDNDENNIIYVAPSP